MSTFRWYSFVRYLNYVTHLWLVLCIAWVKRFGKVNIGGFKLVESLVQKDLLS